MYLYNKGYTLKIIVTKDETHLSGENVKLVNDSFNIEEHISEVLKKTNTDHIQQEIIYLKAENEKIHQLLKEIVPTDEIKKRTFNILTEVLCKNCERVFSLYEELRVKSNEGVK